MYLNYITYKSYFVNKIDKNDSISNLIRYGTNTLTIGCSSGYRIVVK